MNTILASSDNTNEDFPTPKQKRRKEQKQQKDFANLLIARPIAEKFLQDHSNISLDAFFDAIKEHTLRSIDWCEKLGISVKAFHRLRKKFNIEPLIIATKSPNSLIKLGNITIKHCNKYYFSEFQISKIPQSEIATTQLRSARSLKFPNGENVPVKWVKRGRHANNKLKARTDNLVKLGIHLHYRSKSNNYCITYTSRPNIIAVGTVLTKKEVDALNNRCFKMKAFI